MPHVAIIGPGAIGSTVGGAILEAGIHSVVFCGTRSFDRVTISFPDGPVIDRPADARLDPRDLGPADWIFVCVKAHQTPSAAPWFRALLGPDTRVAVLQNGVEHREHVRPFIDDDTRVLPVVVQIPAQLTAPGQVTLPALPHLVVPTGALSDDFAAIFESTRIPVRQTNDFTESLWKKLCLNAANGSLTALTGQTESVFQQTGVADLARRIIRECIAVGRAEGASLDDALPDEIITNLTSTPGASQRGNSMYFDRLAGRPLEADARNGVIVRLGEKHGIPTPINATLYALLQTFGHATQQQTRPENTL